jgi:hypothetical protein
MQCNAMQESKGRLLVKFDPQLGFFTPPKEGYRNRVRQVLDAIQNLNKTYYYDANARDNTSSFLKVT